MKTHDGALLTRTSPTALNPGTFDLSRGANRCVVKRKVSGGSDSVSGGVTMPRRGS